MQQNDRRSGRRDQGSFRSNSGSREGSGNFGNFRSNFGSRGFSSEPREMHKAVCSECGTECEVPFEPKEGKPVFCKECYAKRRPQRF